MANAIRALSMDAVEQANSGHPGMPMGMADVGDGAVLAVPEIRSDRSGLARSRPLRAVGRPRLDAALFAALSDSATPSMTLDEIKRFRQLGSP